MSAEARRLAEAIPEGKGWGLDLAGGMKLTGYPRSFVWSCLIAAVNAEGDQEDDCITR